MRNRASTHRRPVNLTHRARGPAGWAERMSEMESYRNQIINMLDTIEDAALMRLIYNVLHAILVSR